MNRKLWKCQNISPACYIYIFKLLHKIYLSSVTDMTFIGLDYEEYVGTPYPSRAPKDYGFLTGAESYINLTYIVFGTLSDNAIFYSAIERCLVLI